ncbi:hypothetical protein OIU34_18555 [Pararhizobium sp. BT-229]|uniref:hypothetical protein n=1 Tax=Pararhizobium sp. BT-229 TaxID=2986923 RepID=UPI0021F727B3|nr:hypothetical protein [Pararhizobium sp. BT-229]MCV9963881.1 hypothetical protein [Pararhizobium sp. BT-229]
MLHATPVSACLPAGFRTPENSIDIAEGTVVATFGTVGGVPVPLTVTKLATLFHAGEGVAVILIDGVVKGEAPWVIVASDGLANGGAACEGDMPTNYSRVTLLSGSKRLTSAFRSFFPPFGFHATTYEGVLRDGLNRGDASF